MKAVFNDLQDHSSALDGAVVHNREGLFALLDSVRNREQFGCELVGENGYKLTLGIGNKVGFVQHSPSDGDTPYLLALAPEKHCDQEYAEFLVGDTPTPIPGRFCLPLDKVKDIAAYFVETGGRSPVVSWEEI
jgi:Immunity protein Imm1